MSAESTILDLPGGSIHITFNENSPAEIVRKMFSPWIHHDNPFLEGKRWDISVSGYYRGYQITSPHLQPRMCNNEMQLYSTLEFYISQFALDILKNNTLIHAAVVSMAGAGALLVGGHGAGKTTLALTAISSGFSALTDEVGVILDDCTHAIGFPRPFRIMKNTHYLTPSIIPEKCSLIAISDTISYVNIEDYYKPETTLKYLFFPVKTIKETTIRPVGEAESIQRLLPLGFNFHLSSNGYIKELIQLISQVKPYEILFHDHWEAIRIIRDMLEESA